MDNSATVRNINLPLYVCMCTITDGSHHIVYLNTLGEINAPVGAPRRSRRGARAATHPRFEHSCTVVVPSQAQRCR